MTWGDAIIDAPKNYPEKRNAKAAEVVNILVQLEGITEERAFTLLLRSQFGMALINEITKAWHYPEYWAYFLLLRFILKIEVKNEIRHFGRDKRP